MARARTCVALIISLLAAVLAFEVLPTGPSAGAAPAPGDRAKLGELPYFEFDNFDLTDRLALQVNLGTGNAVLRANELSITGTGLNLDVVRYFNAQDGMLGSFGRGWTMGTGTDVRVVSNDNGSATFHGPSGFEVTFDAPAPGASTFVAPNEYSYADLERITGGGYKLTYDRSEEALHFDASGRVRKDVDRNGNTITFDYDGHRLRSITDTQGRVLSVTYETCQPGWGYGDENHCHGGPGVRDATTDRIARLTDATGRQWTYEYTPSGQLVRATDPTGAAVSYGYDDRGDLVRITDPLRNDTSLTYDSAHRVLSVTEAANTRTPATTRYGYSGDNTTKTDPNGHTTTYTVDEQGRITKTVDPLGNSVERTYDAKSNVTQIKDALSASVKLTWDNENLTKIQASGAEGAEGPTTSLKYDDPAHPHAVTEQTDPQQNTTSYQHDGPGNLTGVTTPQPVENEATNTYETDGSKCGAKPGQLCTTTDFRGNKTHYRYNTAGNLTRIEPPAPLGPTTITPDALSRPVSIIDGRGQITARTYDAMDRIVELRYGGATKCRPAEGTCITYAWDANGNLRRRTDATGTTTWDYDARNRPTVKALPDQTFSVLGYDLAGNVVSYSDDGGTVRYGFDAANNLTRLAEPGGSCATSPTTKCTTLEYDGNNRRTAVNYPNGVRVTMAFDDSGRQTNVTAKRGNEAPFVSREYDYTTPGGVDSVLRHKVTDEAGNVTTYRYDGMNRLTTAETRNAAGAVVASYSYSFDGNGNRVSDPAGSHSFNAANQLTDPGYTFDGEGNQTAGGGRSFAYNAIGQTSSITAGGTTTGFAYADADSTERTRAGRTTYLNGLLGQTRSTAPGQVLSFTRDPDGNLISLRSGTGSSYFVLDALGSVIALTDGGGNQVAKYDYDPFGQQTATTGAQASTNPFRFVSGFFDSSTGLTKFGTRYYDPAVGRWTQQDPIAGSIDKPGTVNRYAYVGNDPVNAVDPSGRDWWNPFSWSKRTWVGVGIGMICVGLAIGAGFSIAAGGAVLPAVLPALLECGGSVIWGIAG